MSFVCPARPAPPLISVIIVGALIGLLTAPSTAHAAKTGVDLEGEELTQGGNEYYFGASVIPFKISGLTDVDISNWEDCGVGAGGSCPEGRIRLPLSQGNSGPFGYGFRGGWRMILPEPWDFLAPTAELGFHYGGIFLVGANGGADIFPLKQDKVRLGAALRAGMLFGGRALGTTESRSGYASPVRTDQGIFDDGSDVSANTIGLQTRANLVFEYQLSDLFALRVSAGYQLGLISAPTINVGDDELELDDDSVVQSGSGNQPADLDMSARSSNFQGMIGISTRTARTR